MIDVTDTRDGQTNIRTLDHLLNPAPHTVSITTSTLKTTGQPDRQTDGRTNTTRWYANTDISRFIVGLDLGLS